MAILVYGLNAAGLVPHMVFLADHVARSALLLFGIGCAVLPGTFLFDTALSRLGSRREP